MAVIKWKHFPRYWPCVRGIHRLPVNTPHKGRWRGALKFSFMYAWTNGWVNNREAGDLIRHRPYYCISVMWGLPLSVSLGMGVREAGCKIVDKFWLTLICMCSLRLTIYKCILPFLTYNRPRDPKHLLELGAEASRKHPIAASRAFSSRLLRLVVEILLLLWKETCQGMDK